MDNPRVFPLGRPPLDIRWVKKYFGSDGCWLTGQGGVIQEWNALRFLEQGIFFQPWEHFQGWKDMHSFADNVRADLKRGKGGG